MNNTLLKKTISFFLSACVLSTSFPVKECYEIRAEEAFYPYTMFAGSSEEGAITIHSQNICVNGDIASNGTIVSDGNINVNGKSTEHASMPIVDISKSIDTKYFGTTDLCVYNDDYILEDTNIIVNSPTDVEGVVELNGNITIDSALKAGEDIFLLGEVKNTNNSIVYSETGDIVFDGTNVSINGLIYAPNGNIEVTAQNLNLNNVILISDRITLNCPNVNANYNSEFGRFISEHSTSESTNIEFLSSYGIYDDASNRLSINWYSNVDCDKYTIWESCDNVDYYPIAEVYNDTSYDYSIDTDFEKKYFKVSFCNAKDTLIYSTPFVVEDIDGIYYTGLIDSDNDKIVDIAEEYYKTDINLPDSDNDGLTDYEEIFVTYTDPLVYDSYNSGISDSNADLDNDGLTNRFELDNELNPLLDDCDNDGVSDGEEVNNYNIDPLNSDTDNDGALDGWEIENNYDPHIFDESFKVSKRVIDDDITVSVNTVLEGYQIESLTIKEQKDYPFINSDMPGYIAPCFDFSVSGTIDEAEIIFELDDKIINDPSIEPVICYFNEKTQKLEELETVIIGNSLHAKTTHFSKYAVVNKISKSEYTGYIVDEKTDIVFVIDYSQSMDDNDPNGLRLQLTNKFIDKLSTKDRAGIVSFVRISNVLQDLTNDKKKLKEAVNSIVNDNALNYGISGTNGSLGLYTAIDMLKTSTSGNKCIVFLTDGQDTHTSYSYDSIIKAALNEKIKIYSVSLVAGNQDILEKIANSTYGHYSKAADDSALNDIYVNIEDDILDKKADKNNDNIPDYINKILCQGLVCYDTGVRNCFAGIPYEKVINDTDGDYDNDGLKNGEELKVVINDNKISISMTSYPILADSDGDGLLDGKPQTSINENGKTVIVAPKDPKPFDYDGPDGIWKAHIENSINKELLSVNDKWLGHTQPSYENTGWEGIKAFIDEINYLDDNDAFDYELNIKNAVDLITITDLAGDCLTKILTTSIPQINIDNSKMKEVYVDFNTIMSISKKHIKNPDDVDEILAALGSRLLNFKADKNNVVHSQYNQWQLPGGYNNFYDAVFNVGTAGNMAPRKYSFIVNKEYSDKLFGKDFSLNYNMQYILWMWKGDYLNIGAGSEVGIYSRFYSLDGTEISYENLPISIRDNLDHYFVDRDYSMPMQLHLYNYYSKNNIEKIYTWFPSELQWWVTGFNPAYVGRADVNTQIMISCVDFSKFGRGKSNVMLNNFLNNYGDDRYVTVDKDNDTVWFMWY